MPKILDNIANPGDYYSTIISSSYLHNIPIVSPSNACAMKPRRNIPSAPIQLPAGLPSQHAWWPGVASAMGDFPIGFDLFYPQYIMTVKFCNRSESIPKKNSPLVYPQYLYIFFLIYIYMNKSSTNRGFLHTAQITIGEIPWKLTFSMTIGSWMVSNPHFTKRKPRHFCNGIEGGYN